MDLKEQLVKLGATEKALRPHIRPLLKSLEDDSQTRVASNRDWNARLLEQKAKFASDVFDRLERSLPSLGKELGLEVLGHSRKGSFELVVDVTMAYLGFSVSPREESIVAAVRTPQQTEHLTLVSGSTPDQVAQKLLDEAKRLA